MSSELRAVNQGPSASYRLLHSPSVVACCLSMWRRMHIKMYDPEHLSCSLCSNISRHTYTCTCASKHLNLLQVEYYTILSGSLVVMVWSRQGKLPTDMKGSYRNVERAVMDSWQVVVLQPDNWVASLSALEKMFQKKKTLISLNIGKYSFVNRTIQVWNQLPADVLGNLSFKRSNFRKRVKKVLNRAKLWGDQRSEVNEAKYS
jgi:hypothetical protein